MSEQRRIVVIDDSEIQLAVVTSVLEEAGFQVRAVTSLRQFLNAVLDWKPNLIVTDLYMPEMSGAQLCSWLRKQVETARTPIVICSAADDAELQRVARAVGADGYLSKSLGPQALPSKLHELCEQIVF
jgi:CheY-like chemotaxis protein